MAFNGFRFLRIPCSKCNEEVEGLSRQAMGPEAEEVSKDLLDRVGGMLFARSINPSGSCGVLRGLDEKG